MVQRRKIREAVGIFDSYDHMEETIHELESSGFDRRQISVLGSEAEVAKNFGTPHVRVELLEDNDNTPHSPYIRPEELSIGQGVIIGVGMLAGAVAALTLWGQASIGILLVAVTITGVAGGIIGGLLAKWLGDSYAEFFQNQLTHGGLLLWVKTPKGSEGRALSILKAHGARDVHMHEISPR